MTWKVTDPPGYPVAEERERVRLNSGTWAVEEEEEAEVLEELEPLGPLEAEEVEEPE